MPGLIRGVGRTAAVVGTAGAVHHHQSKKWAAKDQQAADAQAEPTDVFLVASLSPDPRCDVDADAVVRLRIE